MGYLVQRKHHQNWGGIGVDRGVTWERKKPAISPKRCEIGPRLLLRTNRKSYTRFRLVPKSVTLNNLERRIQGLHSFFYLAMHFSAKRGIAIVYCPFVCPSVCLSVTLRYRDHIISRPNSLRPLLWLTPTWVIWCKGNILNWVGRWNGRRSHPE